MAEVKLQDTEHLCRLVRRSHQVTDGNGNPIGITWAAFELRPGEKYLSVNWLEAAGTTRSTALASICSTLRSKMSKIEKCLLTIGNVGEIKGCFLPHAIRITSESKPKDKSYAAVRRYPPPLERQLALEKLAAVSWNDWSAVSEIAP